MSQRKTTIRDVADKAGVSITSVSLYLNDKPGLSDATRERIEAAIRQTDYTPQRRRSGASLSPVSFVGLLVEKLAVSTFSDMFYGEVLQALERQARTLGYSLVLLVVDPATNLFDMVAEHSDVEGFIVLGGGDITQDVIRSLARQDRPLLLVDNQSADLKLNCVVADNFTGAHQAVQYLVSQGYERIAFIQGPAKYRSLVDRFFGYCSGLTASGRAIDWELVQPSISSGLPNKGYHEMRALLAQGKSFDAVLCVSDRSAFGALQALQEADLRVPADVAVMGFDNVSQAAHTRPALTTIEVPKSTMGMLAMRRLHELITGAAPDVAVKNMLYTSVVARASA
ncbi:MAG: LacI family DNA-binding transcriptional regulator [Anaerolineae bacterium]|nr:LacI family DNA-binding transcriptional regulator [Anaerolineae bacterium]